MKEFQHGLEQIRAIRHKMREARHGLQALLDEDMADSLSGPTPQEMIDAEEITEPGIERGGGEKWRALFELNWPEAKRRKRRWLPWASRR